MPTLDIGGADAAFPAHDGLGWCDRLYGEHLDTAEVVPPTPRIEAYVEALLERWADLTGDDDDEASPWSDGPLINNASGPIIYFGMSYNMAEEVSAEAARMAAKRGLVCFDVQWDRLRPAPEEQQAEPPASHKPV